MKRFRIVAIVAALGLVGVVPAITAPEAEAHGWVTSPPSRQDNCATGATSFDCGGVKYEPQSVEAPKGSMLCSGGNEAFAVLDDASKAWPVANVGTSLPIKWKLTAAHNTSLWEYFVDGKLHQTFDEKGAQPSATTTHTLTNLPAGRHTILARWNVSNTPMAFYNCVDINVGGTGNPDPEPTAEPTAEPTSEPGECVATPWSASATYQSGATVVHNGREYRAGWWTQGDTPGEGGAWGVWRDLGPCGDGGPTDPTDEPTEEPTVTPTVDPTTEPTVVPTTDPTTEPGTCTAAAWNASNAYQGGALVTYQGHTYKAGWWTQGDTPGAGGEWGVWRDQGACDGTTEPTDEPTTAEPTDEPTTTDPTDEPTDEPTTSEPETGDKKVVGYFTQWGVYGRNYHVKNIDTSGSAAKLTHILYAFGNVSGGKCVIGDSYADYEKAYTADQSVNGQADTWDQSLRGNFNQLRQLKAKYPHIKVLWSMGGWTWSGGFGAAAATDASAKAFAKSCHDLVEDPRWADVFDGIDIDWEYPNACGLTCDTSGSESYPRLLKALRTEFGNDLVTSAITADGTSGGKIDAANYAEGAKSLDFIMPMTYDYFGTWAAKGPTAPHSPLTSYPGMPQDGFDSSTAIAKLKSIGIPANKILLGIGFYGRGWTGVTQATPGGTATGAAPATYEAGNEDYKVLKNTCPATGTVAGTAYAFCNGQWWSYDTPATINGKMAYTKQQNLAGAFFWELSGDTSNGELVSALSNGLK